MKKIVKWQKVFLLFLVLFLIGETNFASAAEIRDQKWVEGQNSAYYNDGHYSGILTEYLASGDYTPPHSKTATDYMDGFTDRLWVCTEASDGGLYLVDHGVQRSSNNPSQIAYNSGGYVGTLYRNGTDDFGPSNGRPNCTYPGQDGIVHWKYGAPYSGIVTKPAVDTRVYRFRGWVEAVVRDPSIDKEKPGTTDGSATGQAYWELVRNDLSKASDVETLNLFTVAGEHYATRNLKHESSLAGRTGTNRLTVPGLDAKGKNFAYSFQYEYTNHYREVYDCVDSRTDGCYAWKYKGNEPAVTVKLNWLLRSFGECFS